MHERCICQKELKLDVTHKLELEIQRDYDRIKPKGNQYFLKRALFGLSYFILKILVNFQTC